MNTKPNNITYPQYIAAYREIGRRQILKIVPAAITTISNAIRSGDAQLARQLIKLRKDNLISLDPVAHFLIESGRGDIVLKALRVVQRLRHRKQASKTKP